jgi:hypothetical protein
MSAHASGNVNCRHGGHVDDAESSSTAFSDDIDRPAGLFDFPRSDRKTSRQVKLDHE